MIEKKLQHMLINTAELLGEVEMILSIIKNIKTLTALVVTVQILHLRY